MRFKNFRRLVFAGLGLVAVVGAACGSDPAPPTAPAAPAATATSMPQPTATAEPTVTQTPPTPVPLPESKPFTQELRFDADPLPKDEVVALWTEYLSDTKILGEHRWAVEIILCGDGTGFSKWRDPVRRASLTWSLVQSGDWNSVRPILTINPNDPTDPPDRVPHALIAHAADGFTSDEYSSLAIVDLGTEECSYPS